MASIDITNFSASVVQTFFGPVAPGQTKNFSGFSRATLTAQLPTLNALVASGTINFCSVADGSGLIKGADVLNVFGQIGVGAIPAASGGTGGSGFAQASNITITQPVGLQYGYVVTASGSQGGISNGTWTFGRPYTAGVGLQAIQWRYHDDSVADHIVASMEAFGTFGMVGNGSSTTQDYRSRFEAYNADGEENPNFRYTTYPRPTVEIGRNGCASQVGALVRSGSTVTATIAIGHFFEVGDILSLTCSDPNYPQGLNIYTVASVPDSNHFTYTSSGTTTPSTSVGFFTTETDLKFRSAGKNHLTLVMGDYTSENLKIDFYADSMVTAAGYGASYGGSILYQPTVVTSSTYALAAGTSYWCNATSNAVTFNLASCASYFGKAGRHITVKKTDSSGNAVTVTAAGSDRIDGASTKVLGTQYKYVTLESDGSANWYVVGSN